MTEEHPELDALPTAEVVELLLDGRGASTACGPRAGSAAGRGRRAGGPRAGRLGRRLVFAVPVRRAGSPWPRRRSCRERSVWTCAGAGAMAGGLDADDRPRTTSPRVQPTWWPWT